MLFEYESVIKDMYLRKNNLKEVGSRNKKFKEYKKFRLENKYLYVSKFTTGIFIKNM